MTKQLLTNPNPTLINPTLTLIITDPCQWEQIQTLSHVGNFHPAAALTEHELFDSNLLILCFATCIECLLLTEEAQSSAQGSKAETQLWS